SALAWLACPPAPGCPAGFAAPLAGAVARDAVAEPEDRGPGFAVAPLAFTPPPPGCAAAGGERAALVLAVGLGQPSRDYPPLVEKRGAQVVFASRYVEPAAGRLALIREIPGPLPETTDPAKLLEHYRPQLDERKIDAILVVPPGFQQ